jgi:hypothetical protein
MTMHSFSDFYCITFTSSILSFYISSQAYVFNTDVSLSNIAFQTHFCNIRETAEPVSISILMGMSAISGVMVTLWSQNV